MRLAEKRSSNRRLLTADDNWLTNRPASARFVLNDETGDAVFDDLRHGAAAESDDGSAAWLAAPAAAPG
jgi:hypothetical protein